MSFQEKLSLNSYQIDRQQATGNWEWGMGIWDLGLRISDLGFQEAKASGVLGYGFWVQRFWVPGSAQPLV